MAGVDYSMLLVASSAGPATVNVLKAPTNLIGVVMNNQWLGIQLDPVRIAYIPNVSINGTQLPIIPVWYPIEGLQINVIYQVAGQIVIYYFGEPLEDSVPLEAYSGVVANVSVTNSGTSAANVTTQVTVNFPQGSLRLTGIAYFVQDTNSVFDQWSFNTAGGLQLTSISVIGVAGGGRFVILPLDFVPVAQSLTVTVIANNVAAGKTHQAVIIFYYSF